MISMHRVSRVGVSVCVAMCIPALAFAQRDTTGGPLTRPPLLDAPFSADATTTVRQTLSDGTRIERIGRARYYRDRAGRIRVEQEIIGLEALNAAADGQVRITILPDPSKQAVFTLDPVTRTAHPHSRDMVAVTVGGGDTFALPLGGGDFLIFHRGDRQLARYGVDSNAVAEESLGSRRVAGVEVIGRRITVTLPVGQVGNDRPIEIVDERWESPELGMVIHSRHSDPRTGNVEYRLTNIRRTQPAADLFQIPADYTIDGLTGQNGWIKLHYAEPPRGPKRGPDRP
jgi:hypothetical protein